MLFNQVLREYFALSSKRKLSSLLTILTFTLISFSGVFTAMAYAENTKVKEINFKTPRAMSETKFTDKTQIRTLLSSPSFINKLTLIAQQLPADKVAEQAMFQKTALMSMRSEHQSLIKVIAAHKNALSYYHYTLYSQAVLTLSADKNQDSIKGLLKQDLGKVFKVMSDEKLVKTSSALGWSIDNAEDYLLNVYKRYYGKTELTVDNAIDILVNTQLLLVLNEVIPVSRKIIASENNKRYHIEPEVLITTKEGIELTATIVRKKSDRKPRPTAFQFTIYADEAAHIKTAIHAAAHGYVGVVANSRGKRLSTNKITPWEHDGKDATAVIDWLTKQPWSDGRVVMYGGSYDGFTQWAAAKYMHPALKTIVPYAAASPITGLPYENNIALTGNYEWNFFVTNNKTTDNSVYANWEKSNKLVESLFQSGRSLQDIDKLDGKANPWFQKLLKHPSYDKFYQAMLPYQHDYANINIPVLSITGYFDGGQISAIDFLTRHYKYNKNAKHSLLIGPYGHHTAQGIPRSHHSNYKLDEVALEKDTEEIAFTWFDHVLYGKAKPELVKERVNYQLMGSNTWQHTASYQALNEQSKTYYLSTNKRTGSQYSLLSKQGVVLKSLTQTVDMTDRTVEHNPQQWNVIQDKLNEPNGLVFVTEPMKETQQLAGAITGQFSIAVNKKDVDIGYNFYELMADGKVFHLNHYQSRASYANDMSQRQLLTPNQKTTLPIVNGRMTAKLINKGSRLVMVLNVNKNANAQVNMGSGKDVSTETIDDAGEILTIKWFNDSMINIPLKPWHE